MRRSVLSLRQFDNVRPFDIVPETFVALGVFTIKRRWLGRVPVAHRLLNVTISWGSNQLLLGVGRSGLPSFLQIGCESIHSPLRSVLTCVWLALTSLGSRRAGMRGVTASFFPDGTWVDLPTRVIVLDTKLTPLSYLSVTRSSLFTVRCSFPSSHLLGFVLGLGIMSRLQSIAHPVQRDRQRSDPRRRGNSLGTVQGTPGSGGEFPC